MKFFSSEEIWKKYYDGVAPVKALNGVFGTEIQTYWQLSGANDYSIEIEENGNVADIRIRIDGGNYNQGGLKRVLSLAHVLECNLFLPELSRLLQPNKSALETLNLLIKSSKAYKYSNISYQGVQVGGKPAGTPQAVALNTALVFGLSKRMLCFF